MDSSQKESSEGDERIDEEIDNDIFELINQLRQAPQLCHSHLKEMLEHFDGNVLSMPGHFLCTRNGLWRGKEMTIKTQEGAAAVLDALEFLEKQQAVRPLIWNSLLTKASRQHVEDIGQKSLVIFDSSDGTTAKD